MEITYRTSVQVISRQLTINIQKLIQKIIRKTYQSKLKEQKE